MSLIDHAKRRPTQCLVGTIAEKLSDEDADDLATMLDDPGYSDRSIANALTSIGHPVTRYTVTPHRRKLCACYREDHA